MKGLELSERYFEAVGLPMLKQRFSGTVDRIAAGLVGDGSECYGYDDSISQDHDWGPGFCVWLTLEDYEETGAKIQDAIHNLPGTFEGHGPRRVSIWGEGRVGAFEIGLFYKRFIGMDRLPRELDEWLVLPENALSACTNGRVFTDPLGEFSRWRETLLAFYPEDIRRKKIAARCMTVGQSGQYNFPRCVKRGELFAAQYAETKFCADMISMVFLLNHRYSPFYKWMHRAVKELPVLGGWVHKRVSELVGESDLGKKEEVIEVICTALIHELVNQELTDCTSTYMPDHGPAIQGMIEDKKLRERNVWVG